MRLLLLALLALPLLAKETTLLVHSKDGATREVTTSLASIRVTIDGKLRSLPLASLLSVHNGEPATADEAEKIAAGVAAIQGKDRAGRDLAVEQLTAIGVPVMTPLLQAYKDTEQQEPRPLYRLFERIMPSHADTLDRSLSIIRQARGPALRGVVEPFSLGAIGWDRIRFLAVKQKTIARSLEVHSIRHSTQIESFDTAVYFTSASRARVTASGFTRLSWDVDGWASDPDGLKVPGPKYKTNLVDGHPFGALVGRFGAVGSVFLVGRSWSAPLTASGKLYLAINDNRHWQNNLGSYRVLLMATNAYDVGDPQ